MDVETVPMSPDYVLRVLVDDHRQACQFDPEVDREAVLTIETTVARWREACDLLGWRQLGHALNSQFGTSFSDREWKAVLKPARKRTLWDVCELISRRAVAPRVTPLVILGRPCMPAGAFLLVRSLLEKAGADVSELRPSTALAPWLRRRWLSVFLLEFSKLAPGALPPVRIEAPCCWRGTTLLLVSWAVMMMSFFVAEPRFVIISVLSFGACWLGRWIAAGRSQIKATFGELKTFADLSRVIAAASDVPPGGAWAERT